jgi:hypothetical protein
MTLRIIQSGILAREICRRGGPACVAAVFARSLHLRCGEMFVCVGEPGIGNGPLTLIAEVSPAARGLHRGQAASISGRCIAIGAALRLTFDGCEQWCPPAWPAPQPPARLIDTCTALACRAASEAPPEGFAPLMSGEPSASTRLSRIAGPRIARFASWLSAAPDQSPAVPAPIAGLVGLGPGLTPSGDDFLSGALALLDALGERSVHAALARAIAQAPSGATSPLSRCLLNAAAAGHVGEHLCRAVSSVISGNVAAAIAAVQTIGHSSGWDMMVGIVTTLRIVANW